MLLVLLVLGAIAIYFFFYQAGRLEAATIRNFRALDAAADRVAKMLGDTLPKVIENTYYYSADVIEQIELSAPKVSDDTSDGSKKGRNCKNDTSASVWNQLENIYHNQSENMPEHTKFKLLLRPKFALLPPYKFELSLSSEFEHLPRCKNNKQIKELLGSDLRIEDCRPLKARSFDLYNALKKRGIYDETISHLNRFGMRSTTNLNPYMSNATKHLSAYFDKYIITDGSGRAIFNSDDVDFDHSDEIQTPHRKAIAFTNHEDIYRLLRIEEARLTDAQQRPAPIGSSALKSLRVGDVDLSIFIHPFTIQGMPGGSKAISRKDEKEGDKSDGQGEGGSPNGKESTTSGSVFHIIGIVTSADLRQEAVRLELGRVVDATLLIFAGIALLPIVWFWTAGDRLVIGRWVPCLLGTSGVLTLLFYTVMFLGHVTKNADEEILDKPLISVAQHMVQKFNAELKEGYTELREWNASIVPGNSGDTLGEEFFCPTDEDRSAHVGQKCGADDASGADGSRGNKIPVFSALFSLDSEGKQVKCQFNRRKSETPKLDLEFRPYFKKPYEGKSWAVNSLFELDGENNDRPPYFIDRIDSIIRGDKATVLSMPVSDKRPECKSSQSNNNEADMPVVVAGSIRFESLELGVVPPTFAYAVVEKDTGRILFNSDDRREFVANFIRSVGNSYHVLASFEHPTKAKDLLCGNGSSAKDSAKAESCRTKAEDSPCKNRASTAERGGNESCQRKAEVLLYDNKTNIIDLHYDGVPIRALVSELRPEIPWRLVVYRGYEIDSRLSAISSLMTIIALVFYFVFVLFPIFMLCFFLLWLDVQSRGKLRIMRCLRLKARDFVQRPGLLKALLQRLLDVHIGGVLLWILIKATLVVVVMFKVSEDLFMTLFVCFLSDIVMLFWALSTLSSGGKSGGSNTVSSFAVTLLLVGLVVLPTIASFLHFRSSLTWGAGQYIADQVEKRNVILDDKCRGVYKDYKRLWPDRHPTSRGLRDGNSNHNSAPSCRINEGLSREIVANIRGDFCQSSGLRYLLKLAEPFVAQTALSKMIIRYSSFEGWVEGEKKCPLPQPVVRPVPERADVCS